MNRVAVFSMTQDSFPGYGKHPFHEMVLAFGESESAAAGPEGVVPQLGVVVHAGYEAVCICVVVERVFDSLEVIVVNESCHAYANAVEAVRGEVGRAVAEAILEIEVCTAVESPCSVRGRAALAEAVDPEVGAVGIVASGYAK